MLPLILPQELSRLEELDRRCRHAAMAGAAVCALWILLLAAALSGNEDPTLERYANPWLLLDVVLVAALSLGVRRHSRAAACLLLAYLLITVTSNVLAGYERDLIGGAVGAWLIGRATHATFSIHRLQPQEEGRMGLWAKAAIAIGILIVALGAALVGFGVAMECGLLPDVVVVPGSELRASTVQLLRDYEVLGSDEEIAYFYSQGMFSFLKDGNFFTDKRVVSYSDLDGERYCEWALLEDIAEIDVMFSATSLQDSVITIRTESNAVFMLLVSAEEKKDHLFYDALISVWHQKRPATTSVGRETV